MHLIQLGILLRQPRHSSDGQLRSDVQHLLQPVDSVPLLQVAVPNVRAGLRQSAADQSLRLRSSELLRLSQQLSHLLDTLREQVLVLWSWICAGLGSVWYLSSDLPLFFLHRIKQPLQTL